MVAVGLAAASGDLSGVALAGSGGGNGWGTISVLRGNGLLAPLSLPIDLCGNAVAVIGASAAGCASGVSAGVASSSGTNANGASSGGSALTRPRGAAMSCPAGSPPGSAGPLADLQPVSGLTSLSGAGDPAPGSGGQTFGDTLNAPGSGAGNTDGPAADILGMLAAAAGILAFDLGTLVISSRRRGNGAA